MTGEAPVASPPFADHVFGVDIGGTNIKGALVDVRAGCLVGELRRSLTPRPATPVNVAGTAAKMVADTGWCGRAGVTFPAVIKHGIARSAANVDPSWRGTDAQQVFAEAITGNAEVVVLNDADAAGLAQVNFGAARGVSGVVILLTFGTGIGSALIVDGRLVPNAERGHLELDGRLVPKPGQWALGWPRCTLSRSMRYTVVTWPVLWS